MATDTTQQRLASRKGACFHFADFVLDTLPLELRKGTERIEAQPKALHLLRLLLENAGQAVTKEDLPAVASRAPSVLALDPANRDGLNYFAVAGRALTTSGPPQPGRPEPSKTAQSASFANGRHEVTRFLNRYHGETPGMLATETPRHKDILS